MSETPAKYIAHGNLIITGEYFVLKGARALAVPLKKDQHLSVRPGDPGKIHWTSQLEQETWFTASYSLPDLSVLVTSDREKAEYLAGLFTELRKMNASIFNPDLGYRMLSHMEFNPGWGWGSSATLIRNLATWAGTDPFVLNAAVSKGSGYDIAAAGATGPIIYQRKSNKPVIENTRWNPNFSDRTWLVYLGSSVNTNTSIRASSDIITRNIEMLDQVDALTNAIVSAETVTDFCKFVEDHEALISSVLSTPTIKEERFNDYSGTIKSLGAWGGDFVLALSEKEDSRKYFSRKGLHNIYRLDQIAKLL